MKLPALIIFKERGGKLGEQVTASIKCPYNVKVKATTNGWMTTENILWWFRSMWKGDGERRLLILDHYKLHYGVNTQSLLASLDTDYVYIPAGCTGTAQIMVVSINAPFKKNVDYGWSGVVYKLLIL